MSDHRYIIGIDLGTTNSVVAYTEIQPGKDDAPREIRVFSIPQIVDEGSVADRDILPSFVFLPESHDVAKGGLALPWDVENILAVGEFARNRGEEIPMRLISSAKSWLCHTQVDRNKPILPWKGAEDLSKLSPVEASAAILSHIRDAWNHAMAQDDELNAMEFQEIYLTVPASFDAVARELTVKAATLAGLDHITLLEEPQAAFYAWINNQGDRFRKAVKKGELVLVCDVGGGTTDFSLIRISDKDGELSLERLCVGNHLLVGGDNMDLALSYTLSGKFAEKGTTLDSWQMRGLSHTCRRAKEKILSNETVTEVPVTVLGRGSGLIGGTLKESLTEDDMDRVILNGFFPACGPMDRPRERKRAGLRELGLSYEADPAITRHLAAFLAMNPGSDKGFEIPDAVLFNGGIMKAPRVRERILDLLGQWSTHLGQDKTVREISSMDFDLSVARGAAYYGLARQGKGIRIRAGLERAYYVAIESSMPAIPGMDAPLKALCVAGQGMEEGTETMITSEEFVLVIGEPVVFDILGATRRKDDQPGTLVDEWEPGEIEDIARIETTLDGDYGKTVPVNFEIRVTEIGTLEFWCVSRESGEKWKLEFNVRENDDDSL
ncbi:MAG: Hsp70 family protein [Proteobacteria bacterium]|nr:Hsp70 family protein [Pseudomonadota bacterium]